MAAKLCPETPRQKMINMMYIVLTAMLALNVPTEILDAFKIVDLSLQKTIHNFEMKNNQIYNSFEMSYIENPGKVKPWRDKALQVKSKSDSLVSYIQQVKVMLAEKSGCVSVNTAKGEGLTKQDAYILGVKGDTIRIKKQDDMNIPAEMMLTAGKGKELKKKINEYRDFLLSYIDAKDVPVSQTIKNSLDTSNPKVKILEGGEIPRWENVNFEKKPLVAVMTLLSKMQIDVRNSEANVINYLFSRIDASSFKFNKLEAEIVPKSNYILAGGKFEATIFLSATDTTQNPEIYVNNQPLKVVDGKAVYSASASSTGIKQWNGYIRYKTASGSVKTYPFKGEYEVANPSFSISPTKMNVFYMGVPNPVSVSVAGISMKNLRFEMSNGRIENKNGQLFAYPGSEDLSGKKTIVSVLAVVDGKAQKMSMPFRVKHVPDPIPTIAGRSRGFIRKEELASEDGIFAELKNFDFDLKFRVNHFKVTLPASSGMVHSIDVESNRFNSELRDQFRRLKPGSKVFIDEITARGEDGSNRELAPISFQIK
ncbi:MAG: gliding motility protein GldM [Bacteroidota bacterium]|nr:gliding motility protein GldM [Bacteroidota bacterium]MDP4206387.1 gliding motility protein GldM [Bacteroidota bacterium]